MIQIFEDDEPRENDEDLPEEDLIPADELETPSETDKLGML
jgi:hypothetical protein